MGDKAGRYWISRLIPVSIVYTVSIIVCIEIANGMGESPWRYLVILIPAIPIGIGTLFFIGYLRRMDEMQRQIQLNAIGFSVGLTGMITLALGLMESVGLPPVGMIWVFPMLIFFWGIGSTLASWRYR